MIADVDATVANWLRRLAPDLDVAFNPPPADGVSSQRERLVVTAFLHDVREDPDAGVPGWTAVRDDAGMVVGRQQPTRAYRFAYLLIAFGADAVDEHQALGRILCGSVLHEVVADADLAGQMKAAESPVIARCAPATRSIEVHELWSAWGLRPRTTLELLMRAPMPPAELDPVVDAPTHLELGARRLAADRSGAAADVAPRDRTSRVTED